MKYGKWIQGKNIGQGGSGRTYICQENAHSHEYVLKILDSTNNGKGQRFTNLFQIILIERADMENKTIITNRILDEIKTKKGGYTKKQLSILKIEWPPQKGWKIKVINMEITLEELEELYSISQKS